MMSPVKEVMIELVKRLPDECTWDDVMYQVYVRQKIEAAVMEADEGKVIPHEEVFEEFSK
jgi:predicted transcriptional regulator